MLYKFIASEFAVKTLKHMFYQLALSAHICSSFYRYQGKERSETEQSRHPYINIDNLFDLMCECKINLFKQYFVNIV